MNVPNAAPITDFALAQRARASTLARRRKRLAWRIILFTIITAAMIFVAVINRDTMELRDQRRIAQRIAEAYERKTAERGSPPLTFPYDAVPEDDELPFDLFYPNIFYAAQASESSPSGVCCLKKPVNFYVRTTGRTVVLYDGAHFDAQWMTEDDFRKKAQALGFSYLLTNTE